MSGFPRVLLAGAICASVITLAGVTVVLTGTPEVSAQSAPRPCTCSRGTALVGTDEATPIALATYPRSWVFNCQCATLTCVSQLTLKGDSQLVCVK